MGESLFGDPMAAILYDRLYPWGGRSGDEFYLEIIMATGSVLDVGCGTGTLLRHARDQGHTGRLVGLDPAEAMLEVARARETTAGGSGIEWVVGDAASVSWAAEFDLVIMTGHAFQELVSDQEVRHSLSAMRGALRREGRLVFETRNPAVRAWERWTPDHPVTNSHPMIGRVRYTPELRKVDGDTVTFTGTYAANGLKEPISGESTLRFLDVDSLDGFLADSGLAVVERYGSWNRDPLTATSPEIITVARRV
ncbi:class I SAM-dependent methyltransferase [Spiractinospora alimapuensis]|uniref:class I SAM-dependent methyltransferase n=1 Tax=Spiractinospora alimapuensis TaxID=2820884 RepID=UPI001F39458C|nr:class I SAM-dependent methyltransferase [Spiractinospora alimapuensis]QVQ52667.1 class I SAM-dependent methyltransferase [Spiractinospora alimapuensis]